eukprot:COSAG03_NODE_69_length_14952_cov_4.920083_7_plen_186_part_00
MFASAMQWLLGAGAAACAFHACYHQRQPEPEPEPEPQQPEPDCHAAGPDQPALGESRVVRDGSISLMIRQGALGDDACLDSGTVDALITVSSDALGAVSVQPVAGGPSGMQHAQLAQLATDLREQVASLSGPCVDALGDTLQDYLERRNMDSWDDEEEMMVRAPRCSSVARRHCSCARALEHRVI